MTSPLILVVEDEAQLRRFLRSTLTSHGFQIMDTTSGNEALKIAADYPPDLMILDLGLPDIDGLDVARRLRTWSEVPIVVLSAVLASAVRENAPDRKQAGGASLPRQGGLHPSRG